jgi:DMSO/TMAO reductase YedYZ heme-binding membrane subunit
MALHTAWEYNIVSDFQRDYLSLSAQLAITTFIYALGHNAQGLQHQNKHCILNVNKQLKLIFYQQRRHIIRDS